MIGSILVVPKINIKLKITKPIDLSIKFAEHVQQTHGKDAYLQIQQCIAEISNLRKSLDFKKMDDMCVKAQIEHEKISVEIDRVLSYARKIEFLDSRFQSIGEKKRTLCLDLRWIDTLSEKEQSHTGLCFEMAGLLYNYSALNFTEGMDWINSEEIDKLKLSFKKMKQAYWGTSELLRYLPKSAGNITFNGDISPPNLFLMNYFYRAMVGVALYQIAIKSGNFSKEELASILRDVSLCLTGAKNVFDREQKHVLNSKSNGKIKAAVYDLYAICSAHCYMYMANEYQQKHNDDNFGGHYGVKMGYLILGKEAVDEILKKKTDWKDFERLLTPTDLKVLENNISNLMAEYTGTLKRNNEIYKQAVPNAKELPAISEAKAELMNPTPPPAWTEAFKEEALFSKFIPPDLLKLKGELDSEIQTISIQFNSIIQEFMDKRKRIIQENKLNLFIMDNQGSNQKNQAVTPEVLAVRDKFISLGGAKGYSELVNKINSGADLSSKKMFEIKKKLDDESAYDSNLKRQHGANWKRLPSEESNKEWVAKLNFYEKNYKIARGMDQGILQSYNQVSNYFQILEAGESEILKLMPKSKGSLELEFFQKNKTQIDQIKKIINVLEEISKEYIDKDQLDFTDALSKIDALKELLPVIRGSKSKDEVFKSIKEHLLLKITPLKEHIDKMEPVLAKMTDIGKQLSTKYDAEVGASSPDQNKYLQFTNSVNELSRLHGNLVQGAKFYEDLLSKLASLEGFTEDYLVARNCELQMLLEDIQNSEKSSNQNQNPTVNTTNNANMQSYPVPVMGNFGPPQQNYGYYGGYAVPQNQYFGNPQCYGQPMIGGYSHQPCPPPQGYYPQQGGFPIHPSAYPQQQPYPNQPQYKKQIQFIVCHLK